MKAKKILKRVLFPPPILLLLLVPASVFLLILSFVRPNISPVIVYFSYTLAAYTLTVLITSTPVILRFFKRQREENKWVRRWYEDLPFRLKVSLFASLGINFAYAVFHIGLGIYHQTFWFLSLGAYYLLLACMRLYLAGSVRAHQKKTSHIAWRRYRACGYVLLLMNTALSLIIFFMVYWGRTFVHSPITTITMATYTFTALSLSIVQAVKHRHSDRPIHAASTAISLAAALVSVLTLESTMLTTFQDGSLSPLAIQLMLGGYGLLVSLFILGMALYMITHGTNKLKSLSPKGCQNEPPHR